MLEKLSGYVLRKRRVVLLVAAVLALLGAAASATLFSKLSAGGFSDPHAESGRANAVLESVFGDGQRNLALLVTTPRGVDDPAAVSAGTDLSRRLAAEPRVTDVNSYWTSGHARQLRSADGKKALLVATIVGNDTEVNRRLTQLLPHYRGNQSGLDVKVGGYALLQEEMNKQSQQDASLGETITLPVTLIALVLIFGSIAAASLPLIVAVITALIGMGLMWLLAEVTDVSVFGVSVVTLLGLGLAIDYSLLIVNRYREELRSGMPAGDALRATMGSAGRTVLFSALTVAVSLAGTLWFPLQAVRSVAYGGIITATLSATAALTVLPALLVVMGKRVEKGRLLRRHTAGAESESDENGSWHRLATFVMRRPVPIATVVTAILLLLGAPFLGIKLGMPDERVMPKSSVARQVATTIRAEFDTSEQNALQVVSEHAPSRSDATGSYAAVLSRLKGVARVDTVTGSYSAGAQVAPASAQHQRFAKGGAVYLSVVPAPGSPDDVDRLVGEVRKAPAPFPVLVGGTAAINEDTNAVLFDRLPYALGTVGLAMVILLFLITGSVLIPWIAIVLSALSLTATFGALVWVFQDGHLTWLFGGVSVSGTTTSTIPVMLFALAFGLAMDYQVFMLSRIREEYERTGSGTTAVAMGLERIGRIVTAAAVIISIVFLAFTISPITFVKAYGIGLPLAVLMDATLIRGALLPAVMRLGGRATWWAPPALLRLHMRFSIRESAPSAPARPTPISAE